MRVTSCLVVAPLASVLMFGAVPARAETTACTPITTLPAVITVQGIYCFTQHLDTGMTSGNAIEIRTNNVILDLNGWKLGGLAAGSATDARGIYAINRQNITIRNGTVRGFRFGIFLQDSGASQGHVVEDIRADQNTQTGMWVEGNGTLVRNNQVVGTGGTTFPPASFDRYGIFIEGTGPRVLNNDVIDVERVEMPGVFAASTGILFFSADGGLAVNNRITNARAGIGFVDGTGKYRDNLTTNVTTPFVGGTAVGIND